MGTQIFVNLPVSDLNRSVEFFTGLGFNFNKQFTDEKATSMVIGEDIFIMLLVTSFFQTFTKKEVVDAKQATECIIALSMENKEKVDQICLRALKAGAVEPRPPQDQGFMYYRCFQDLDGHLWELIHMDPDAINEV